MNKIKNYFKKLLSLLSRPVMSILPGQLAFSFVLTITSILVLVAILASIFGISLTALSDFISSNFPKAVSEILLPLIKGKGFDIKILAFILVTIWLASNGAYSIITASDVIYNIKSKSWVSKRIKSFIMTIILIVLILFILVVLAFGDLIIEWIVSIKLFTSFADKIKVVYYVLKYPLSFLIIYFNIKLIYTIAPNKLIPSMSTTKGSLFTSIMWIIVTEIYSFWVTNVAHYDIIYGSISNIIILFIWIYFLAYVFTIGLILNKGIEIDEDVNNIK